MDYQTLEIIEKEISTFVRRIVMSEKQSFGYLLTKYNKTIHDITDRPPINYIFISL